MTTTTELISGMDKIIQHMKNQEKEIKALKEKIKELKKEEEEEEDITRCEECQGEGEITEYEKLSGQFLCEDCAKTLGEKYCNGVCCERSPKHGKSWWKELGFNSACKCAKTLETAQKEDFKKFLERQNISIEEHEECLERCGDYSSK